MYRKRAKPRDVIRPRQRESWMERHERELEEHRAQLAATTRGPDSSRAANVFGQETASQEAPAQAEM